MYSDLDSTECDAYIGIPLCYLCISALWKSGDFKAGSKIMKRTRMMTLFLVATLGFSCSRVNTSIPVGVWKEGARTVNKIVEVVPDHVFISTYPGVEEKHQIVNVFRLEENKLVMVGRVRLVQFKDRQVKAEILNENGEYRFSEGDLVHLKYKSLDRMNVGEYIDYVARRDKLENEGDL